MKWLNSYFEPHYRLVYMLLLGLLMSGIQSVKTLLFLTACWAIFAFWQVRRQYKKFLFYWLKFNLFSVLIFLTLSWKIGGDGIEWHRMGVELATQISLRMNAIMLMMWAMLHNVNDTILVQAIAKLPLPSKLIQLTILTVRYIALLGELNHKMDMAMRARGFKPKCNFRTLEIYAQRVALLLIHAMIKAEQTEIALKARGFRFKNNKQSGTCKNDTQR